MRILVLDDCDTWESVSANSQAVVVPVNAEEMARLHDGESVAAVLLGRVGSRLVDLVHEVLGPDEEQSDR